MGTICSDSSNDSQDIILNPKDQQQYECTFFQEIQMRWLNFDFQIEINKDKEIIYKIDEKIVRIDKINKHSGAPKILTNLEQIKYLSWSQQLEEKNRKIMVKQTACWKGQELSKAGGYYSKKSNNYILNYYTSIAKSKVYGKNSLRIIVALVYELGEYFQGEKQGKWRWMYILINKNNYRNDYYICGHGSYKEQGKKHGKWIELSERFWDSSQVTYKGEYKNGIKNGIWDCYWNFKGKNYLIGGGLYKDQFEGDSIKNGIWIEISDGFWNKSQITYIGLYKNGNKVGRWEIYQSENQQKYLIGGGSYTNEIGGTSTKIGKWIELNNWFWAGSQVLYVGQYKNGKKVGKWDIKFSIRTMKQTLEIGGGFYSDEIENDQVKIGKWIEISDGFRDESQVTYRGNYKNGQKVGRWNIVWQYKYGILSGGGFYNEEIEIGSTKIGNWIEISDEFSDSWQMILCGEYINGKKIGKWVEKQVGYYGEKEIKYEN